METASGRKVESPEQIDDDKSFITPHGIIKTEELTELTDHRESNNHNIWSGNRATRDIILEQINLCEEKIGQIMKEPSSRDFNSEAPAILSKRINDLYILLFKAFSYDVDMLSDYIEFCSKNEYLNVTYKTVLDEVTSFFHSDPEMYSVVAHHVFEDCNDIVSARQYISIGKQYHSECKNLYIEEFWIEVQHLDQTGETSLQTTLDKYNQMVQHFKNDIHFHFELVDKALEENIKVTQLQCTIIRDMVEKYRRNALMWQKLAKTNLNGYVYDFDTEIVVKDRNTNDLNCIRNLINTYNKALQVSFSPAHTQNIWELFLDDVVEIYNSNDDYDGELPQQFMKNMAYQTFNQAYSNDLMRNPKHFIFWVDFSDKEYEIAILKKGLSYSNDSYGLWLKMVEHYINKSLLKDAMRVLFQSVDVLKEKSLPLLEIMELCVLTGGDEMIEQFYQKFSIQVEIKEINLRFRPEYLEWRVMTKDIMSGRKIFKILKKLEPKCLELYTKMIQYETLDITNKGNKHIAYMRQLYSEACNKFGHMDVDIWYNCMRFEYMYGTPSFVDLVYKAAMNLLENSTLKIKIFELKNELDSRFNNCEVIDIDDDE